MIYIAYIGATAFFGYTCYCIGVAKTHMEYKIRKFETELEIKAAAKKASEVSTPYQMKGVESGITHRTFKLNHN